MENLGIPLAALIISIFTFMFSMLSQRRLATREHMSTIETRLAHVEKDLETCEERWKECKQECDRLSRENTRLLQMLFQQEQKLKYP